MTTTTKERAFIARPHEARGFLAGTQTQARRPFTRRESRFFMHPDTHTADDGSLWFGDDYGHYPATAMCPHGGPGERLIVKETHAWSQSDGLWIYRADGEVPQGLRTHWFPAITMKRSRSRLTLEITEVRVQRVGEISEEDAKAEGITGPHHVGYPAFRIPDDSKPRYSCAVAAYEALWESLHGAGSWALNPWVWALTVRVVK